MTRNLLRRLERLETSARRRMEHVEPEPSESELAMLATLEAATERFHVPAHVARPHYLACAEVPTSLRWRAAAKRLAFIVFLSTDPEADELRDAAHENEHVVARLREAATEIRAELEHRSRIGFLNGGWGLCNGVKCTCDWKNNL